MIGGFPVSCVMPTCNRRRFVPYAIECFLRQDYADLELLVLDDGDDPVADLVPRDPRIRYVRRETRLVIGAKRNLICELAAGDVIVHWDDDDWSAPWRVSCQVAALEASGADVCGLSRVLFYEPAAARAWEYCYPAGARPWAHGATLCYRKSFWRGNPFPEIHVGEDTRFVWSDRVRHLLALDDRQFYVGTIHAASTSPKRTSDPRWRPRPVSDVAAVTGDDWMRYRAAVGESDPCRAASERIQTQGSGTREAAPASDAPPRRVRIGIHLYQEAERLRATIAAIQACTRTPFELLLLPDGPDDETTAALATLDHLPQSATRDPRGAAASFNRLAAAGGADVIVLLESGCIVTPGWLDRLLAALDSDPRNGLAGPSTNLCWNEQGACRQSGSSPDEIARAARDAAALFGDATRALEPLHSLADFCYAVRREVVDAIGAADEGYGLGPCWEMDYNIRAARAGFRGVWACAAYVHRSPFAPRRALEEARQFDASKRRYQDKFCGGRLRREKSDYRPHCRGDACPNFAPASLIRLREPLPADRGAIARPALAPSEPPLASCIMPTTSDPALVRQAVRWFLAQDYPRAELVIVDDGTSGVADRLPEDGRVRCVATNSRLSLGARRNLACTHARGEVIVHWDENHWSSPRRLQAQLRALSDGRLEVCGAERVLYYDALTDRAWDYRSPAGAVTWRGDDAVAYVKGLWARNRFPEDPGATHPTCGPWGGAAGAAPDGPPVVILTDAATTRDIDGGTPGWRQQPSAEVQALLGDDIFFYRTLRRAAGSSWPLVSCIMPTCNRRPLVPLALQLFSRQDYPNLELIVVDDGDDAIDDLIQDGTGVRYFKLPRQTPIGAKRNFACQQARGEIIVQWDDDDWYAPERVRYQAAPILSAQADLTGLENPLVLEPDAGRFWTIRRHLHQQMFFGNVHGGTLVFRRQLFDEGVRYPELNLAEDAWLLKHALDRGKRLRRLPNAGMFVYMRHGRNAWRSWRPGQFLDAAGWEPAARPATFPAAMLARYQDATACLATS